MLAVWLWALVDAFMTPPERVRALPKAIWIILVLLFWIFGAAAWFVFGHPRGAARVPVPRQRPDWADDPAAPRARQSGPLAPDDDPDFLFRLHEELRRRKPDADDEPHS